MMQGCTYKYNRKSNLPHQNLNRFLHDNQNFKSDMNKLITRKSMWTGKWKRITVLLLKYENSVRKTIPQILQSVKEYAQLCASLLFSNALDACL
jgi:hypothetical protein